MEGGADFHPLSVVRTLYLVTKSSVALAAASAGLGGSDIVDGGVMGWGVRGWPQVDSDNLEVGSGESRSSQRQRPIGASTLPVNAQPDPYLFDTLTKNRKERWLGM